MGDLLQNHEIFKKLGFDISNQWIMDLEPFQNFFIWIAENISDLNVLSDIEILHENELKNKSNCFELVELNSRLDLLNQDYPSILKYQDRDVIKIENNIKGNKTLVQKYGNMNTKLERTKANLFREVRNVERQINELENEEKELFKICLEDAKIVQDLERSNKKLCSELNNCFTKLHEPPLFIHQLPMDQYILKCESFKQYLTLYLQENFKFQDYLDDELGEAQYSTKDNDLGKIKNLIIRYNRKYVQHNVEAKALHNLTNKLDPKKVHIISINELRKETKDLEKLNRHNNCKITYKTLMNDLNIHLDEIAQQQIERILYENTNLKLGRATQRIKNVEFLSKIVSDALLNTELLWILMQLDLEKIKNRFDNTDQLNFESQQCLKRIEFMRQLQFQSANELSKLYCGNLIDLLGSHIEIKSSTNSNKNFLLEYYKFNHLIEDIKKKLQHKNNYKSITKMYNELKTIESNLVPYLYNGPVKRPCFENVSFLKHIFETKIDQRSIEEKIRQLRTDVQKNINERMINDPLWKNSQLLWVWFLTEPKRVLIAIEEVKKAASKVPALTGLKTLSGIKRM